jgi:hypothetical protein
VLDNEAAQVGAFGEGRHALRLGRGLDDGAEILIGCGTANREGAFDLKPEGPGLAGIVERNNKVIHRIALATLLDGNAGNDAGLASSALVPQEMRKIIGDDGVFISEARAAGQLGGSWFLFKCIGQGAPPGNRFYGLVIMRARHVRGAGLYLGAIWVATRELVAGVRFKPTTSRL